MVEKVHRGAFPPSLPSDTIASIQKKFADREEVGIWKYGGTVDENPESERVLYWLRHAQEEAMDLVVYIEKLLQKCSKFEQETGIKL